MSNNKPNTFNLILFTVFLTACAGLPATSSPPPATLISLTASPTAPLPPISTQSLTRAPETGDTALIQFHSPDLIHDLAWSPDGSQLAIAAGTDIHIYAADSLAEQRTLAVGIWSERIAFHPSQPILAAAGKDGRIRFWDTVSGKEICGFVAHPKGTNSLAFQPGGGVLLATTGIDIISRLWDISSVLSGGCDMQTGAALIGASYTTADVAFSPDGQAFALVDIHNIRLRESGTRKLIATLKSDLSIFDLVFSPDSRWLAAAQGQGTLAVWELAGKPAPTSNTIRLSAGNPQAYAWRVDFSSDSRLLAGGASDGSLLVWDSDSLQPVFSRSLSDAVSGLAFQPGTHLLAVGTLDGSVYFWEIK